MYVRVYIFCMCVYICVCVFVGSCLPTEVFISRLQVDEGGESSLVI